MKTNVTFVGYPLSFEKVVDIETVPDIGEPIRVSSPYGTQILNGYVTERSFDGDTCNLEVTQA